MDDNARHHLGEWTEQTHLAVINEKQNHASIVANMRVEYAEIALKLQKAENDAHFERLNGEAGRLAVMQATYLPREVYEAEIKAQREWRDGVNAFMAEIKGRVYASVWIFTAVVAVITIVQHFWK
jgi:hypothetical protein